MTYYVPMRERRPNCKSIAPTAAMKKVQKLLKRWRHHRRGRFDEKRNQNEDEATSKIKKRLHSRSSPIKCVNTH